MVNHFYNLEIWKTGHKLRLEIYELTRNFPTEERYAIVDQIRRAAASVCANIAEGFGRYHFKDKIKFYYNSRGSVCEVQDFIVLAKDLGYLDKKTAKEKFLEYGELNRRINSFINSVGRLKKPMTDD